MIALALLLAISAVMAFSSIAETRIDGNFQQHKKSYYAARAGLEEVRDRMRFPSTSTTPGGISDLLPTSIPGTAASVMYVVNPAGAETVDPADASNSFFDFELCHEYDPNAAPGQKCKTAPTLAGWELPLQASIQTAAGQPLSYKWVRINLKTNRVAAPYCVDGGACAAATLDNRVCWNGTQEVLAPDATTRCGDLNMHQVYMLSSFSTSFGARSLTRYEVADNSVRPPAALNLESQESAPSFNNGSEGTGVRIPPTNIDGRARDINGNLLPAGNGCAATSSIATDSSSSTGDLQGALVFSDSSIEERGDTPYIWLARGDVLLARKEKRATYCFEKAILLARDHWLWPWLASRVHTFYRQTAQALKFAQQALALDPVRAIIWQQLGRCEASLGLASKAQQSFERARELDRDCPELDKLTVELNRESFFDRLLRRFSLKGT